MNKSEQKYYELVQKDMAVSTDVAGHFFKKK